MEITQAMPDTDNFKDAQICTPKVDGAGHSLTESSHVDTVLKAEISDLQRQLEESQRVAREAILEKEELLKLMQFQPALASSSEHLRTATIEPPWETERHALRLQRAENALEQERAMCAQLRRQLESALNRRVPDSCAQHSMRPSPHAGQGSSCSSSDINSAVHSPGEAAVRPARSPLSMHTLSEAEQLQQELRVAQTQLLQRTVEAERLRGVVAEREAAATRLRHQLEGLMQAGRKTLDEEQELERKVDELSKANARLRVDVGQLRGLEESWSVRLCAAQDRTSAAEHASLDVQRQCEAAATTITRLIDENSELTYKINVHGQALAAMRTEVRKRDATVAALEQLMASQGGRWGSAAVAASAGGRGRDGLHNSDRASDPLNLRAELAAAVEAAFRAQRPCSPELPSTPLNGIPEAEWKVRALEEEIARMETELGHERGQRLDLERQLQAEGVGSIGPPAMMERLMANAAGSIVASAAAACSGLPVNLRIQALAQSLAMLEEDLEKERGAMADLRLRQNQQQQQPQQGLQAGWTVVRANQGGPGARGTLSDNQAEGSNQIERQHHPEGSDGAPEKAVLPHSGRIPHLHLVHVFDRRQEPSPDGAPSQGGAHQQQQQHEGDSGQPPAAVHPHLVAPFSQLGSIHHAVHGSRPDPPGAGLGSAVTQNVMQAMATDGMSASSSPDQPVVNAMGHRIAAGRADSEEMTLVPEQTRARKKGGGVWGWLTGVDVSSHAVLG